MPGTGWRVVMVASAVTGHSEVGERWTLRRNLYK